jgi:hypothetical protein
VSQTLVSPPFFLAPSSRPLPSLLCLFQAPTATPDCLSEAMDVMTVLTESHEGMAAYDAVLLALMDNSILTSGGGGGGGGGSVGGSRALFFGFEHFSSKGATHFLAALFALLDECSRARAATRRASVEQVGYGGRNGASTVVAAPVEEAAAATAVALLDVELRALDLLVRAVGSSTGGDGNNAAVSAALSTLHDTSMRLLSGLVCDVSAPAACRQASTNLLALLFERQPFQLSLSPPSIPPPLPPTADLDEVDDDGTGPWGAADAGDGDGGDKEDGVSGRTSGGTSGGRGSDSKALSSPKESGVGMALRLSRGEQRLCMRLAAKLLTAAAAAAAPNRIPENATNAVDAGGATQSSGASASDKATASSSNSSSGSGSGIGSGSGSGSGSSGSGRAAGRRRSLSDASPLQTPALSRPSARPQHQNNNLSTPSPQQASGIVGRRRGSVVSSGIGGSGGSGEKNRRVRGPQPRPRTSASNSTPQQQRQQQREEKRERGEVD